VVAHDRGRPFTKIGVSALDHRRFWMRCTQPVDALAEIEQKLALAMMTGSGWTPARWPWT